MMKCPNCSNTVEDSENFCHHCAHDLRGLRGGGPVRPGDVVSVKGQIIQGPVTINHYGSAPRQSGDSTLTGSTSAEVPAFHISYEFAKVNLPAKRSALAQVAITISSGEEGTEATQRPPLHMCMILDVSLSMNAPDKYPLLLEAIPSLVSALSDDDHLTIVLFSTGGEVAVSDKVVNVRNGIDVLKARIGASGVLFGNGTMLSTGIARAIDAIKEHRRQSSGAFERAYMLTDGQLHDPEESKRIAAQLRTLEVETHSYGFGKDFASDTMRAILSGLPGGSLKTILTTSDVVNTFQHVGDLSHRIVGQNAVFSFEYAKGVTPGDGFQFRPARNYYGSQQTNKRFEVKLGALERGRSYIFMIEARVPPSEGGSSTVGTAKLSFVAQTGATTIEKQVICNRTEEFYAQQQHSDFAQLVLKVMDAERNPGDEAQLEGLYAQEAYALRFGPDPAYLSAIRAAIRRLESGQRLSEYEKRVQGANFSTQIATRGE